MVSGEFGWFRGGSEWVRMVSAFSVGFHSEMGRIKVVSGGSRWFQIVPSDFGLLQVGRQLLVPATGCLKTFLICEFNLMLYRRNLS